MIRVFDAFSGIGGFRSAFERASAKIPYQSFLHFNLQLIRINSSFNPYAVKCICKINAKENFL